MKEVYFVRHAKSSWSDSSLRDHDRPLNKRGKRDAPRMARRLLGSGIAVDGILTSTAKRARHTARAFREAYGLGKKRIIKTEDIYHASRREIEKCIQQLPEEWDTVLVFGHNPGYTDVANSLIHDEEIDNVPTCGIVGSRSEVKKWSDWKMKDAKRTAFYYPKRKQ